MTWLTSFIPSVRTEVYNILPLLQVILNETSKGKRWTSLDKFLCNDEVEKKKNFAQLGLMPIHIFWNALHALALSELVFVKRLTPRTWPQLIWLIKCRKPWFYYATWPRPPRFFIVLAMRLARWNTGSSTRDMELSPPAPAPAPHNVKSCFPN